MNFIHLPKIFVVDHLDKIRRRLLDKKACILTYGDFSLLKQRFHVVCSAASLQMA
jgi:hypothetical protein